jgi:hypothetical protein
MKPAGIGTTASAHDRVAVRQGRHQILADNPR